jgi:hypothetical protein
MATRKGPKQRQRTGAGEKGWPVRLATCESAIRKQDEHVFMGSPRFVDLVVSATESRIEEANQKNKLAVGTEIITKVNPLDFLCERGCPRRELLYLLGMCENRGVTNSLKMTGFDSEDLNKLLGDIRAVADNLWALSGYEFGSYLEMEERSTLFGLLRVPEMLREYASLIEHAVGFIGGKSDFYLHVARARLVSFVKTHTGKYHDAKVARLLSVMLGPEYLEGNHRVWRDKLNKTLMHYQPDPGDSPSLRAKKTLLECRAAIFYRSNILHSGKQYLRKQRLTVLRPQ